MCVALHGSAHTLGVDSLGVGFDVRTCALRYFEVHLAGLRSTRLYVVHWEDGREAAEALDDRLCEPEVCAVMTMTADSSIAARVCSPSDLGARERDEMFELFCRHFDQVSRQQFEHDLFEKMWC